MTDAQVKALSAAQRRVLWIAFLINFSMFFMESYAGVLFHSTSLKADSLDMLGDAFAYAMSLAVVGRGRRWKAGVSFIKGLTMVSLGALFLFEAWVRVNGGEDPMPTQMMFVGALALLANSVTAILLYRHRNEDINMRSTWLCSRNDALANGGVILAGLLVMWSGSRVPDLAVGAVIAGIILFSSVRVLRSAVAEWRAQ